DRVRGRRADGGAARARALHDPDRRARAARRAAVGPAPAEAPAQRGAIGRRRSPRVRSAGALERSLPHRGIESGGTPRVNRVAAATGLALIALGLSVFVWKGWHSQWTRRRTD